MIEVNLYVCTLVYRPVVYFDVVDFVDNRNMLDNVEVHPRDLDH